MPHTAAAAAASGSTSPRPTTWWAAGVGTAPDLSMAGRFLRFVDRHETRHAFRLIHDTQDRPAVKIYGPLEQHADQLLRMNRARYLWVTTLTASGSRLASGRSLKYIKILPASRWLWRHRVNSQVRSPWMLLLL